MKKFGLSALVLLLTVALVSGMAIGGDWHDTKKVRKYNSSPTDGFKRYQSQRHFSGEKHDDLFYVRNVHKEADKPYTYYKKRSVENKRSWSMPKMAMPEGHPGMDFGMIMGHVAEQNKRIVGRSLNYATSHLNKGDAVKVKKKFNESFKKEWGQLMKTHDMRFKGDMAPKMDSHMRKPMKPKAPLTSYWQKRVKGAAPMAKKAPVACGGDCTDCGDDGDCDGCDPKDPCDKCVTLIKHMKACPACKPGKPCEKGMHMMKKLDMCKTCIDRFMKAPACAGDCTDCDDDDACEDDACDNGGCDPKDPCPECVKIIKHMKACPECKPGKPCKKCVALMKELEMCKDCMARFFQAPDCKDCGGH